MHGDPRPRPTEVGQYLPLKQVCFARCPTNRQPCRRRCHDAPVSLSQTRSGIADCPRCWQCIGGLRLLVSEGGERAECRTQLRCRNLDAVKIGFRSRLPKAKSALRIRIDWAGENGLSWPPEWERSACWQQVSHASCASDRQVVKRRDAWRAPNQVQTFAKDGSRVGS